MSAIMNIAIVLMVTLYVVMYTVRKYVAYVRNVCENCTSCFAAVKNFPDLPEYRLRISACLSAFDEGIGKITNVLKDTGMWDNTVFFFNSDNGGDVGGSTWMMDFSRGNICQ